MKTIDPSARKHGGNQNSKEAFESICSTLPESREKILRQIRIARSKGRTVDELSAIFDRPPNAISGRVTELRNEGLISAIGTRKTRSGVSATVYALA